MSGRQDSWMPLVNIENPYPPCLSVDQYREPMDNRKIIDCASWHSFPCWWATQPSHCQPLQAPLLLGLLLLSNTGSLPQSLARLIRFLSWEKTRRLKRSASLRWIPEIDVLFASARSIFLFSLTSFGFLKELLRRMKCFFSRHLLAPKVL